MDVAGLSRISHTNVACRCCADVVGTSRTSHADGAHGRAHVVRTGIGMCCARVEPTPTHTYRPASARYYRAEGRYPYVHVSQGVARTGRPTCAHATRRRPPTMRARDACSVQHACGGVGAALWRRSSSPRVFQGLSQGPTGFWAILAIGLFGWTKNYS
ncbi:hypothetical protein F511_28010 [Dorcoceras hygrometricum]|uniref:Uncharacterized protein n=1 Tax=Dorcoceras hygrometricum TaxID=472368 RepID=A0A2Z7BQB5_9LAMI|nr:hypothetical protein F511_28010 [Dorcoceras hygrometricum]